MLKKVFLFIIVICFFFSCKEKTTYYAKVELSNLEPQDVYAVFEANDHILIDTIQYRGEKEFIIKQNEGVYNTLTLYLGETSKWLTVYLEPENKISITGDANYLNLVDVKGGRINEVLSKFKRENEATLKELALFDSQNEGKTENKSRITNLNHELTSQADAYIKKHLNEEASVVLVKDYFFSPEHLTLIDSYLSMLNPKLKDFYLYKELKAYSTKAKRTAIGEKAPEFNIRNIQGKSITTDSFMNSFLILAFTPTWDKTQRTDDLLLSEIAAILPKDSFKILLVSLDENPNLIREQISKQSVISNIVVDSAGQAIQLLDLYNIKSLPSSYIIDEKGKIFFKTESGIELREKLMELI